MNGWLWKIGWLDRGVHGNSMVKREVSMSSLTNDGSRLTTSLVLFLLFWILQRITYHITLPTYLPVFRSNTDSLCLVNSSSSCINHVTDPGLTLLFLTILASGQRIDT